MAMTPSEPGEGMLFQNEKKQGKQPDYRGQGTCPHCTEAFEVAGWKREAKASGKPFLSLKLSPPYQGGRKDSDDDGGSPF